MRRGFYLAEVLLALAVAAMAITTVVALRAAGHHALVTAERADGAQADVRALACRAAETSFDELASRTGALDDAWVKASGADPRRVHARIERTADPDVLLFVAEAPAARCRRLVVRAEATLLRAAALEAR